MDVEIVPCSAGHLEQLIEGAHAFQQSYQLQPIDGYMPSKGALEYILNQMQSSQLWHPWLPAHTLAEQNASTRVLEKCGMNKESEPIDPDVGNLWRWEISTV